VVGELRWTRGSRSPAYSESVGFPDCESVMPPAE
jgi:hypothetical protein